MMAYRLRVMGLLSLLLFCIVPTKIHASENASSHGYHFTATQKALIIAGIVTIYLACSEDARFVVTQATLLSSVVCLRLLLKWPFSTTTKQKIQARIDYLEMVYATNAYNDFNRRQRPAPTAPFSAMRKYEKFMYWLVI